MEDAKQQALIRQRLEDANALLIEWDLGYEMVDIPYNSADFDIQTTIPIGQILKLVPSRDYQGNSQFSLEFLQLILHYAIFNDTVNQDQPDIRLARLNDYPSLQPYIAIVTEIQADCVSPDLLPLMRRLYNQQPVQLVDVVTIHQPPIPVMIVTDINRARALAAITMNNVGFLTTEYVAGWFLTFASIADVDLLQVIYRQEREVLYFMEESTWLDTIGMREPLPDNPPLVEDSVFWSLLLVVLGISGMATENSTIGQIMSARIKNFLTMARLPLAMDLPFPREVYDRLKIALKNYGIIRAITMFVIVKMRGDFPNDGIALVRHLLYQQAGALLSYAELQALRLAHTFYLSDTSMVWTNEIVAQEGEAVQAAWDSLMQFGLHAPYARLLGFSRAEWDSSNYPNLVYCAEKSGLVRTLLSLNGFVSKRITKLPTKILDEMLSKKLELATGVGMAGEAVRRVLQAKKIRKPIEPINVERIFELLATIMGEGGRIRHTQPPPGKNPQARCAGGEQAAAEVMEIAAHQQPAGNVLDEIDALAEELEGLKREHQQSK